MGYQWLARALELLSGVEPYEVAQVLAAQRRLPRSAVAHGCPLLTISGRTAAGRPLIVFLRQQDHWDWLIVGAREMTPEQRDDFERWEQRSEQ